jgi:hypothetical protein
VQQPEKLGAMICTVIHHMEKGLPQEEIIIFSIREGSLEQHFIAQFREISAHILLHVVPQGTNDLPIVKASRVERFRPLDASQSAEPVIVGADEMNDLVADRAMRVVHILDELFMG